MNYYHAATRKFCCCLPVRLGVFVLSALSAVLSGFSAYALWYVVIDTFHKGTVDSSQSNLNNWNSTQWANSTANDYAKSLDGLALDKTQLYTFLVIAIATTIYCLFSVFGFIGSVIAKRGLVAFYSTALWILLVINLLLGVYSSYSVVHRRQSLVDDCIAQTNNNNTSTIAGEENKLTSAACSAVSKASVYITIALFIIQWLIQLYACVIVKRYVEQLSEEQGYRRHMAGNRIGKGDAGTGGYYPHQPLGHHEMMPPPSGPYPYAHEDHSYGNKV
ncbi:hypothetical protein FRB95_014469 [Tulasnella sp. JGI-2019a]|nr:hypothetical protein FRB93_006993 [Tulasnella sp. JGI-2019a]KAG9033680.1 hypothetical protein FRB95_014469 [Tulasnella sp. JGI-2019a]